MLLFVAGVAHADKIIPIELTGAVDGVTVTPIDPTTLEPLSTAPEHVYAAKFTTSDQLQNVIQVKNMSTTDAVSQGCDRIIIEFGAPVGDAWRFHSYGGQFDGIEEIGGKTSHTLMLDATKDAIEDFTIFNWVGSGQQEIIIKAAYFYKEEAAADDVLPIDIQFGPDYNDASVSAYTETWTATKDGKTWTITNFNNNKNGWNFIKCGRKNAESVASIASPAINAVVTNYVITLDKVANVTSATLTIQGENTEGEEIDITDKFVAGDVNIPVVGANGSTYTLTINNASASGNGSVQISKITLYGQGQYVGPVHIENTAETAYTVAEAVALIEAGDALSETVFVKGIVSKVDNFNDQYKSITYWISADGSTEGQQFECYSGKGLEGADFTSVDDVEVGAEVIVKGTMKKFVPEEGDPIYEFNYNNELVSYKAPVKPLFADGKYYIFNKGTEKYLAAGAAWGTHAAVNAEGLDYDIAFADGKYTIDSQVSNGGDSHFLSIKDGQVWNDQGKFGWTITEVTEGIYTISDGTQFVTVDESGAVVLAADGTVAAAQWTLTAAADVLAANMATLANATAENGVDATFFVKGANFNRNDQRNKAWTATKSGGNQTIGGPNGDRATYGCESWNNTFEVSQTITNLPEGIYEFSIAGYGTNGTTKIFANETEATFVNVNGAANFGAALDAIANGEYTGNTTGKVMLIEGSALKIGVKRTEQVGADWTVFDNARLTYFGSIPAEAFKPAYEEALAAAQAALANEAYAAVTGNEKTALEKAIADYAEIAEPTADLYKAAIAALSTATTNFTAAKADYEGLVAAKAAKADFDFAAYPYASVAKKAAAEATLTATATSAADAKAKSEGIDKAFRQYVESNALLEGTYGAVNVTDSIVNPNAQEAIAEPWAVVLGEGSEGSLNILDGEPLTDGNGNSAYKYFDGGNWGANAWDVALEQTIDLPAGKYYLTVAGRASTDVELTLFAGEKTAQIAAVGNAGALFGRGWSDASVEFEMAEAGEIKIGVRGVTSVVHNWMSFTRFRLAKFGVAQEDAPEVAVPEGMVNLITNGNLAGEDVTSFVAKEAPSADILPGRIVEMAGKDCSRGIVVKSADEVGQEGAQDWDTQFWIRFNESLPEGTKLHIEFDYAASKAANAGTQAHAEPGMYQHWAAIGDVSFTTEWQHFSKDITVDAAMAKGDNGNGSGTGMLSVAFNLAVERTAVEYYFDNFGAWAQIPEPVQEWENLIVNSDIEGESMECFYVTEQGVGGPFVAIATAGIGKDGSKAVKVQSADDPDDPTTEETEGTDWDSQFFIRLPYQLPAGTKYKVSFDYKADKAGDFDTQAHANPGQYIHWAFCGSGSFTTEWQTYEAEGTVPSQCDGSSAQKTFQTIAFNLAKNRVATEFVFDNVKFFVPKDIVSSLTKNPDENPVHYPTGIKNVMNEMNAEGIFNLNGQKVMKTQKGLYIKNGKKVVIK